jgi:ABC-type uncharacterized transport system YnjBCD permease subunit
LDSKAFEDENLVDERPERRLAALLHPLFAASAASRVALSRPLSLRLILDRLGHRTSPSRTRTPNDPFGISKGAQVYDL